MDNLDDKIDTLIRDKMVSLLQENSVRVKKLTIKYTKTNKKHTLDHWQAIYDSHDKVFRNMPKDLLRVQREVRLKFASGLDDQRVTRIRTLVNREAEVLIQKLTDEYRLEFEKLGKGEMFDERLIQTRKKIQENLEQSIQKCLDAVNQNEGQDINNNLDDLIRIYGVKESTLHEINIVSPLRNIHSLIGKGSGESGLKEILDQIQEGLRFLFHDIQHVKINDVASKDARQRLKMEVARDTMTVRDVILNAQPLLEQLVRTPDLRNREIVEKSWLRLNEILEAQGSRWQPVAPGFQSLYQYMNNQEC